MASSPATEDKIIKIRLLRHRRHGRSQGEGRNIRSIFKHSEMLVQGGSLNVHVGAAASGLKRTNGGKVVLGMRNGKLENCVSLDHQHLQHQEKFAPDHLTKWKSKDADRPHDHCGNREEESTAKSHQEMLLVVTVYRLLSMNNNNNNNFI